MHASHLLVVKVKGYSLIIPSSTVLSGEATWGSGRGDKVDRGRLRDLQAGEACGSGAEGSSRVGGFLRH